MNNEYTKDHKTVYFEGTPLPGSDPDSFVIVDDDYMNGAHMPSYFAFDKNQLYADGSSREGVQIWSDVDTKSLQFFEDMQGRFFADRFHLFEFNTHFINYIPTNSSDFGEQLRTRDPKADAWWNWTDSYFNSLKQISENYFSDGERVFFYFKQAAEDEKPITYCYPFSFGSSFDKSYFSILRNVNFHDFTCLNEYYSKTKNQIFHLARPIEADVHSFEVIDKHFAKDKNTVWLNGYPTKGKVDLPSFSLVASFQESLVTFAKDKDQVFSTQMARIGKFKGYSVLLVAIKDSDPKTLHFFNDRWATDKNNVFSDGMVWKQIDSSSFQYLFDHKNTAASYAKDRHHLYDANGARIVKGVDGESFEVLNDFWGKDKNVVFNFSTRRIEKGLEVSTFIVVGDNGEAEDKNYIFKLVPATHKGVDLGHSILTKIKKKLKDRK